MNNGNDIQQELKDMGSALAGMSCSMPYSVPVGYFDHFDETVKDHVVAQWGKRLPYAIPAGYFETLPDNVMAAINGEIPAAIPTDMPFTTPPAYFDQLPGQILAAAKAQQEPQAKKIRIPMLIRWAAAAVLVLGVGLGAYRMLYTIPVQETPAEHMLASVQAPELKEYLDGNYRFDVEVIEKNDDISKMKLDEQDIIKYLDETGWDM